MPGDTQAFQSTWGAALSRGETVSTIAYYQGEGACVPIAQPPVGTLSVYEMLQVKTTKPSYLGAPLGQHYDPLQPTIQFCPGKLYWLDLAVPSFANAGKYSFKLYGLAVDVTVWKMVMPAAPTLPIYMELTGDQVRKAEGAVDHVSTQGPITQAYSALYRAHRVEPIKQDVLVSPALSGTKLALDQWSEFEASFRQLVLKDPIAPPMVLRWIPDKRPDETTVRAIEAAIQAGDIPRGAWAYLWDEQELNAGVKDEGAARARLIRQWAPSLQIMATWRYDSALAPLIDHFSPVLDWWTTPHPGMWTYTSCMAQGDCSVGGKAPSGTPMMVLDAPSVNFRAFPLVSWASGAERALYYTGTKMVTTAFTDQFNEGGNGDGTLVYPGVVAGIRMKELRQGSFDVEYAAMAKRAGLKLTPPATGPRTWLKDYSAYEAFRRQVGDALNLL